MKVPLLFRREVSDAVSRSVRARPFAPERRTSRAVVRSVPYDVCKTHPELWPSESEWKMRERGKLASKNPPKLRTGLKLSGTIGLPLQLNVAPAPVAPAHPNKIVRLSKAKTGTRPGTAVAPVVGIVTAPFRSLKTSVRWPPKWDRRSPPW